MLWSVLLVVAALLLGSTVLALTAGAFVSVNRRVDARELIDLVLDAEHRTDRAGATSSVRAVQERMSPPR